MRRLIATVATTAVLATTILVATPGAASANTDDTVTAGEVGSALAHIDSLNGSLVAEPAPSTTDADSAAVVKSDDLTVDVSRNPEEGVAITTDGTPVTVTIPDADSAAEAKRLPDGSVAYAGEGSATAVIPSAAGVQMLTTIANEDSDTRYRYKVDVPDGGKIKLADEGAVVLDAEGVIVLAVGTPWAKDASGTQVPSHFETDGSTLTQVVDHRSGSYNYPVVADPWWLAAIMTAITWCAVGAAQSIVWNGGKWAVARGDWSWSQRMWDAADNCLAGVVFGGLSWAVPWYMRRWAINALKPHVYNVIRWTVLR